MGNDASPVCVVTGVGPGTGAALVRRFAAGGHRVAMLARSTASLEPLERTVAAAKGYPTDVTEPEAVRETFARIRRELGPVRVLLNNAGNAAFGDFLNASIEQFDVYTVTSEQMIEALAGKPGPRN